MHRLLLALALLLPACTATADDPPAPQSWRVELSTAPTLLALTDGDVYAASYGNGVGGSQVYRVDRDTGRLAAQRTVAGQPHGLTLGPTGELWLATLQLPDQPSGTGLQVLDRVTLQTRRTLLVDEVPLSLLFDGDQLWVGDATGVARIDPATGEAAGRIALPHAVNRLARLPAGLLAVGPETLTTLDPATGEITATQPVPAFGTTQVASAGDVLWVVHPDARARTVLQPYDPRTLQPRAAVASPGQAGAAAYAHGDRLWITDPAGSRLLCGDAATGDLLGQQELPLTGPVIADEITVVAAQTAGLAGRPADCGEAD